ncbi:cation:proton antiporter [Candidatus Woesearchaeota archaeon]|nr:cation:proton antiporter [Candidatus Woesearchaeota archaeon]
MPTVITNLTFIAIILLAGILFSVISTRIKVTNVLLFLLFGIFLGNVTYKGQNLIIFSSEAVSLIAVLAIAIIVFDGASRLKLKEFDKFALSSLKLSLFFLVLCMATVSLMAYYLLGFDIYQSLILASLMAATAPEVVLSLLSQISNKAIEVLEIESLINTPLTVLIPFIILDFQRIVGGISLSTFFDQILPFLQQIIVGIGTGVLVGIIIFRIMKKYHSDILSPISIITAALLSYGLAELMKGNGVLAVTTLGLVFGRVYIREKTELQSFSSILSFILKILVFVLVGALINFKIGIPVLLASAALFAFILLIRYLTVEISFGSSYKLKQKIFMTFVSPKGVAVAVVALLFSTLGVDTMLIDVTLLIMFYSVVVSSVFVAFSKHLIGTEVLKKQ